MLGEKQIHRKDATVIPMTIAGKKERIKLSKVIEVEGNN
jgi:hypothetical protein